MSEEYNESKAQREEISVDISDTEDRDVMHSMKFPNGMVATFGFYSQQMPELQDSNIPDKELEEKIRARLHPDGKGMEGF